ncbi:uncharacterized protein LOC116288974 isoform X3 [Actinia tenebrosa]|uniref:Uncharacterized protein LOC116288974 isoform X3 n=1 Tax=Actinia tenebrosa TaxID=6105 RepID=A0A6P8H5P9_ACTTE|nr:uncharacterized protein LOC116288974 isoform X3 [Actinia tenebrosa]
MASNQEIVDQSSSNIDVMVVPESPDVAPNSPSLIGGLTNDQAAGTSTGDAGTSKKDEQPARKRIRIDLDEDSEEEGEEDEESKKDLEDLINGKKCGICKHQRSVNNKRLEEKYNLMCCKEYGISEFVHETCLVTYLDRGLI